MYYSYFAPDPENREKSGLILGAALILDGILCNLLLKKSGEKDPPLRYQGCRQAFGFRIRRIIPFLRDILQCPLPLHRRSILQGKSTCGRQHWFWQLSSHFPECICMYIIQRIFWVERFWESCADISDAGSCRKQNNIKGRYKAMRYQFWGLGACRCSGNNRRISGDPKARDSCMTHCRSSGVQIPVHRGCGKIGQVKPYPGAMFHYCFSCSGYFWEERYTEFCVRAGIIIVIM